MIETYYARFGEASDILKHGNRNDFIAAFKDVRSWFGEHATRFLEESCDLLAQADMHAKDKRPRQRRRCASGAHELS